ncbi:serine threonine- kinase pim-2-like protein [Labeo rohita]|uniref:non-specific serine/threonine protein kinase n=1 Tax=Labeo rohita TaxID=84645 RepID=A0A498P201_LABRO|nr:serine threonine- kinase pim-2-like protein [Labeo rohita]
MSLTPTRLFPSRLSQTSLITSQLPVVIKRMRKSNNRCALHIPGCSRRLLTEVALLLMLRRPPVCPYIIEMYEWFDRPLIFSLVLEFPQPCVTLQEFNRDSRGLTEPIARGFMQQSITVLSTRGLLQTPILRRASALGITLYMMVNMRPPFSSVREILQACIYIWKADISMACCDLIYQCLDCSPVKQLTFTQILQHKWFESPE